MKFLLYIAFFLSVSSVLGQTCDTLFSHERYVERRAEIQYRNCGYVFIDSTYNIVQWNNFDPLYQDSRFITSSCFSIFHSETGKLLEEGWKQNDTVFVKRYFGSGRLKRYNISVSSVEPYYFHEQIKSYYENGQLRYEGEYKSRSFSLHRSYYPDGSIESVARRFSFNPNPVGAFLEYFPNGQISLRSFFSEPDTTTDQYQSGELLSEEFFTETGEPSNVNLNEYDVMYVPIYPPMERDYSDFPLDDIYPHGEVSDQPAYQNDMQQLKDTITSNLKEFNQLTCSKGVAWISLLIPKTGEIEWLEVEFDDDEMLKAIEKSIRKIERWTPALKDGNEVDVYVYTFLVIDV